jgi:hypothetical protein
MGGSVFYDYLWAKVTSLSYHLELYLDFYFLLTHISNWGDLKMPTYYAYRNHHGLSESG